MFFSPSATDIPKNSNDYLKTEYAYIRCINLEDINRKNSINATFSDDGKYYITTSIHNISEKEIIMQMYDNEKFFGADEEKSQKKIVEKLSVETKNNFFDYYD